MTPYDTYGHVWLFLRQGADPPDPNARLHLEAAFFVEDHDPLFTIPGHQTTETTPDGVVCDLYSWSIIEDPPEPDPPPELDGGRITAGADFDPDRLGVVFVGDHYRSNFLWPDSPDWPTWIDSGAVAVQFEGEGSSHAEAFRTEVTLSMVPEILSPPVADGPVPLDDEGNILVSWSELPGLADETVVSFQFTQDWDDSGFVCYPGPGVDHFRLPSEWVRQGSGGWGYMMVTHLNSVQLEAGGALVTVRTMRTRRQSVGFLIH